MRLRMFAIMLPLIAAACSASSTAPVSSAAYFRCTPGQDVSYDQYPNLGHIEATAVEGGGPNGLRVEQIAGGKSPDVYGLPLYNAVLKREVDLAKNRGFVLIRFKNIDVPPRLAYAANKARCGGMADVAVDKESGWRVARIPFQYHASALIGIDPLAKSRGHHPIVCVTFVFDDGAELEYTPIRSSDTPSWQQHNTLCAQPTTSGETGIPDIKPGNQAYRFMAVVRRGQ
jgi:hypothetical protein